MTDEAWTRQHVIFERMVRALIDCPVPIIGAVNGAAYGGGCEIAGACDFLYAAETARFALTEVTLGIMPGGGGTQTLPRAVGERRAKELILTGKPFTAARPTLGLVNEVFPPSDLLPAALATASRIARNAPISVRQAKLSIHRGLQLSLRDGLALEIEAYNRMVPTEDRREGVLAFNEKRTPNFKGREIASSAKCYRRVKKTRQNSRSIEQARRVVHGRAFDRQHLQLRHHAAIGGEAAGLVARRQHAVARHHDRTGVAPERLADVARQFDAAELLGDIAIGHGLARRNVARDVVDAAVEFGNAVEIEHDVGEVVRLAREQFDDPVDGGLHLRRRRRLDEVVMALLQAGAGLFLVAHRQLHRDDAALAPHDAAAADRGVEYRKMVPGHGWLHILLFSATSFLWRKSRLGDYCYPPEILRELDGMNNFR